MASLEGYQTDHSFLLHLLDPLLTLLAAIQTETEMVLALKPILEEDLMSFLQDYHPVHTSVPVLNSLFYSASLGLLPGTVSSSISIGGNSVTSGISNK